MGPLSLILLIRMVGELSDQYRLSGYFRPERKNLSGLFSQDSVFRRFNSISRYGV